MKSGKCIGVLFCFLLLAAVSCQTTQAPAHITPATPATVEETASTSVPQRTATSTPATQPDATPTPTSPVFWWELDALPVTLSAAPEQPELDVVFFRADGLWHYDSALAQERRLVTWTADSGRYVPGSLVWSPHQARVAYLTYREDDAGAQQWANVAVVALDTGLTTALTALPVFIPGGLAWSASGDTLYAIGAAETGSSGAGWGLYTLPLDPAAPPEALLTENRAAASLSGPLQTTAEGHVAYLHFEPREIAIRQIDPRQGRVETLAHIPGSSAFPFAAPYLAVAGQPALPENTELLYLLSGEQSGWEERAGLYRFAQGESHRLLAFEGGCGLEAGLGMGRMVAVGCGVAESAPLLICDVAAETCHQLHEPLRDVLLPVINPEGLPFAVVKFMPLGWQETRLYFTAIPYGPDLAGLSGALFGYDTQTGEVTLLLSDLHGAALAAQATDASAAGWIAFVGKDQHLWLTMSAGKRQGPLTAEGQVEFPAWSPDGKTLAYIHQADGQEHGQVMLYTVDAERSDALVEAPERSGALEWSPDGRHLLLDSGTGAVRQLAIVEVASGAVLYETSALGYAWSPDGLHLALGLRQPLETPIALETGDSASLVIFTLETEESLVIFAGTSARLYFPRAWLPDGRLLFEQLDWDERLQTGDDSRWTVRYTAGRIDEPQPAQDIPAAFDRDAILARLPDDFQNAATHSFSWSPDGRWVVFQSSGGIYLFDWETGGEPRHLADGTAPVWQPVP